MDTNQTLIGRTLAGRFRILRCIGKGGMAAVFAAVQENGEPRDVAIKVMKQELMRDRTVLRRFQREAKAASKLSHPNTIRVIAFGVDGEDAYIAMELAKGKDLLQSLAEQRPMHQYRAVNIVAQVCAALSAAHAMGIVHRDLKPENVMLVPLASAPFGELVKVLDFGIAKILDLPDKPTEESDNGPSTLTKSALTRVGTIVGTPAYMSPEQCRGGEIDGRSDLYACGVLLYQLCTGQVPFLGETPLHTAMRHIHAPPRPPTELRRDLHPAVERIILRALAKWPADRPPSASALVEELLAVLPELPDHPDLANPPSAKAVDPADDPKRRSLSSDHTQLALLPSDTVSTNRKVLGDEPLPSALEPSETDPASLRAGDDEEPRTKIRDTVPPVAKLGAPLKAQLKYQSPPGAARGPSPGAPVDDDDDDVRTSVKSPESAVAAATRENPRAPRPPNAGSAPAPRREAPPTLMSGPANSSAPTAPPRAGRRGPLNSTAVMDPTEGAAGAAEPTGPAAAVATPVPPTPPTDDDDDDEQPTALRPPEEVQEAIRARLGRAAPPASRQASIVDGPIIQIHQADRALARPPGARGTLRMRHGERPALDGVPTSDKLDAEPTPKKIAEDAPPPASDPQSLEVSLAELGGIGLGSSADPVRAQPVKNTLVSARTEGSAGRSPAADAVVVAVTKPAVKTQPMSAIQQTVKMPGGRPDLQRRPDGHGRKSQVSLTARRVIEELPGTTGVLLGVGIGVLASIVFAVVIAVLSR